MSAQSAEPVRGTPVSACKAAPSDTVAVTIAGQQYTVSPVEVAELGLMTRCYTEMLAGPYTMWFLRLLGVVVLTRLILMIILEIYVVHAAIEGKVAMSSSIGL